MKNKLILSILAIVVMVLTGCADTVTPDQIASMELVGFWHGLWHGMILPFSWLISLFDSDVAIYAFYNNGGWYDFGFVWGVSMAVGGTSSRINRD